MAEFVACAFEPQAISTAWWATLPKAGSRARPLAQLGGEVAVAAPDFLRQRLVLRRQAFHRIADAAVLQQQRIVGALRYRKAGKTELMQRAIQDYAGMVAGKRPPGAVGRRASRREADDQELGRGIAELGTGRAW